MPHLKSLAADASLVDLFKQHRHIAGPVFDVVDAIMRQPGPFTPAEREAIAAYVSTINACQYCSALHTEAAVNLGMDREGVAAVCERPQAPDNPKLAPVLAYVAKLTTAPATVTQDDPDKIISAGWDEAAVSQAAFIAALYAMFNRIVDGHGIRATPEQAAEGGKRVVDLGYAKIAEMMRG